MTTPVNDARELHTSWADRFNAQDVDGMLALAETESVFVPQPTVVATGNDVRGALEQFLAIGLPITMNVRNVYASGDIALVIADWSLKGTGADGSDVDMSGSTADIARRGPGGWKFVIDNPFGTS
ncbi:MAG TPA: nuclear transport factor 2 family protein [Propionibacteriaceae bacterium]